MSKYVVIGAGRMGRAVAIGLVKQQTTSCVRIVDVNSSAVKRLTSELSDLGFAAKVEPVYDFSSQMDHRLLTSDKFSIMNAIHGMDVCIATSGYKSYVELTRICIAEKVSMVDLGGNRDVVSDQFKFNDEAINADISIIPDCGLAPGMIDILGMHAFQVLSARGCTDIDIHMRVGGLPRDPGSEEENPLRYGLTWSGEGLINEYEILSDELSNGKLVTTKPLTLCERILIENPWVNHEFEAFVTGGGSSNLPFLLQGKARNVDYKTIRYRGHCKIMTAFEKLGFFSDPDARKSLVKLLESNLVCKNDDDIVLARAGARGKGSDGVSQSVVYDVMCARENVHGLSAMAQTTGYSIAAIATLIANNSITLKGVVPGESAVPGKLFISTLKQFGIDVKGSNS